METKFKKITTNYKFQSAAILKKIKLSYKIIFNIVQSGYFSQTTTNMSFYCINKKPYINNNAKYYNNAIYHFL